MNRVMVYPGAVPLETDLLNAQKNDMIGLAKLSAAVLGTATQVSGLACTPNSPSALNVIVGPGEIYSLQNIDGNAYSSLAADTAHQIVKQGILLDQVILSTPAPATAGQSINYLIQATYSDVDGTPVVLPYYNASNPSTAFSGPAGAGTTNNTVRAGVCTVSVKTGVSAATGSQVTPAPDAGNVGLYVVTVANGQTTVTAPNIAIAANAPFISPLTGYAALAGATFTGPVFGQTPAQFDTSTKFATMAAVQRALGNFAGIVAYNTSQTLPVSQFGYIIEFYGSSPGTFTLPLISTVPPAGGAYLIKNDSSAVLTVTRSGTDIIVGGNGATSIVVGPNDSLLIFATTSQWYLLGGSAQLPLSSLFGSSLLQNGYQKLPGGLILQWGRATGGASADAVVTYPIAFPNSCFGVVVGSYNNTLTGNNAAYAASASSTSFLLGTYVANTGARGAVDANWWAFGK